MLYIVNANLLTDARHQEVFHPVNASSADRAIEHVLTFYNGNVYDVDVRPAGQFINEITESDKVEHDPTQLDLFNNKS